MKHIIVFLSLLFFTSSIFGQVKNLKSHYFNYCITGYDWSGWQESNIDVQWNPVARQIIIYSQVIQVINYDDLTLETHPQYNLYSGSATDSFSKSLNIYIQVFFNGHIYLTLQYQDLSYSYALL
jgi:hypothetical protein